MTAQVAVAERDPFSGAEFVVRYGVILVGVLIAVAFALLIPGVATPNTLVAILQTQAVAAIAALGMTLTAVVGEPPLAPQRRDELQHVDRPAAEPSVAYRGPAGQAETGGA